MNTYRAVSLDRIVLLHTPKYRFMYSDFSRSALLSHMTKYHCVLSCHMLNEIYCFNTIWKLT